jgi:hypothetical protein
VILFHIIRENVSLGEPFDLTLDDAFARWKFRVSQIFYPHSFVLNNVIIECPSDPLLEVELQVKKSSLGVMNNGAIPRKSSYAAVRMTSPVSLRGNPRTSGAEAKEASSGMAP